MQTQTQLPEIWWFENKSNLPHSSASKGFRFLIFIFTITIACCFCVHYAESFNRTGCKSTACIDDSIKSRALMRLEYNDLNGAMAELHNAFDAQRYKALPFDPNMIEALERAQLDQIRR